MINAVDGTPVYLNQLAEVRVGGAIRRGVQTHDGVGEVVAGMVVKLFGTNSSTVIERVEAKMMEINRILPEGVKIVPYYEQKELVAECVATVTDALVEGIVLVTLVLFAFLGAPSTQPGGSSCDPVFCSRRLEWVPSGFPRI